MAGPRRVQPSRARRSTGLGDSAVQSAFTAVDERMATASLPIVLTDQPTVAQSATPLHCTLPSSSDTSTPIPVPDSVLYGPPARVPRTASTANVDTSDAAFERRHFRHERAEKRVRRQEIDRVRNDRTALATRIEQMREEPLESLLPLLEARKHQNRQTMMLFGLAPASTHSGSYPSSPMSAEQHDSAATHATKEDGTTPQDKLASHTDHDDDDDDDDDLAQLKADMLAQAEHALQRHDALLSVPAPLMGKSDEDPIKRPRTNSSARQARAARFKVALAVPKRPHAHARQPGKAHADRAQRTVATARHAARARERERERIHIQGRQQLGQQLNREGKTEVVYQEQGAHNIHARTSGGRFAAKPKDPAAVAAAAEAKAAKAAAKPAPQKVLKTTLKVPPGRRRTRTNSQVQASTSTASSTTARTTGRRSTAGKRTTAAPPARQTQAQTAAQANANAAQAEAAAAAAAQASSEAANKDPRSAAAAAAAAAKAALKAAQLRAQAQTLGQRRTAAATAAAAARAGLRRELNLKHGEPIPPKILAARLAAVRESVSAASAATRVPYVPENEPKTKPKPLPRPVRSTSRRRTSAPKNYAEASDSDVDMAEPEELEPKEEEPRDPEDDEETEDEQPQTTASGRPLRSAARKSLPQPVRKRSNSTATRASGKAVRGRASAPGRAAQTTRRASKSSEVPEPEPAQPTRRTRHSEPELVPAAGPARRVKLTLRRGRDGAESNEGLSSQPVSEAEPPTTGTAAPATSAAPSDPVLNVAVETESKPAPVIAKPTNGNGGGNGNGRRGRTSQPAYIPASMTEDEAMAMLQAALADDPDALDLLGAAHAPGHENEHEDGHTEGQAAEGHAPEQPVATQAQRQQTEQQAPSVPDAPAQDPQPEQSPIQDVKQENKIESGSDLAPDTVDGMHHHIPDAEHQHTTEATEQPQASETKVEKVPVPVATAPTSQLPAQEQSMANVPAPTQVVLAAETAAPTEVPTGAPGHVAGSVRTPPAPAQTWAKAPTTAAQVPVEYPTQGNRRDKPMAMELNAYGDEYSGEDAEGHADEGAEGEPDLDAEGRPDEDSEGEPELDADGEADEDAEGSVPDDDDAFAEAHLDEEA